MQDKSTLLAALDQVEQLAKGTKVKRLLAHPLKYIRAILFRYLIYKQRRKPLAITTGVFFGREMKILLPASTDIYLTGGKSHDSEIRLAKFLIKQLNPGDHFVDVGAHYGYFTLLGAALVGEKGKVVAIEAAPKTFNIIEQNTRDQKHVAVLQYALSDQAKAIDFYEFPNLYSEFNSLDKSQFEEEEWFDKMQPTKVQVPGETLDNILKQRQINPQLIKIDVEGAEYQVLQGASATIARRTPIIMEFLAKERGNSAHLKATKLLLDKGYTLGRILDTGAFQELGSLERLMTYFQENDLDSDNIVFL